jgi:23S rRNA (adenine2030-N6)-methyltransferase
MGSGSTDRMNYRHAYHAGNFADVLKHAILARVIEHLKLKPQPFRVIDTHAGIGRYDLDSFEAGKTGEWQNGIGRLIDNPAPAAVQDVLYPYLSAVRDLNGGGPLRFYPGSPLLARTLMRRGDQLVASELHQDDLGALKALFLNAPDTKVLGLDAWVAIKSLLPPKERRGVILIDPPFEKTDEFERLVEAVGQALSRFANGIYIVWYPLKDARAAAGLLAGVKAAGAFKGLDARLWIANPHSAVGLAGTGVLVINPPFRLRADLELLMPYLASGLAQGPGAGFEISAWGVSP